MAEIILVTGGARSGKSSHAQDLAEAVAGERLYIATCPPGLDDEMRQRIALHREERQGRGWRTIEEMHDPAGVLNKNRENDVVLVDCLTLWINNLLYEKNGALSEDDIAARCEELLTVGRKLSGTLILVTNELGCGVVPENPLARRFRDLVGRCNQLIAAGADRVILVVSGIPLTIKGD